jgi:sarcosine oxidase subunit beta
MPDPEVIVIGGGIAGCSTAFRLAALGRRVLLLERGRVAGEASGLNAGSVDSLGWGDGGPERSDDLETWLTAGSLDIFRSLQLDLGHDIELRRCGGLQAIQTEEQVAWARRRVGALQGRGFRIDLLDARDARAIEPEASPALLGAVHSPLRAQADPVKATRALALEAERRGATLLEGHEATAIAPDGAGVRVAAAGREWRAGALVLAAGPWCRSLGRMLGADVPVVPVRGQMWATAPLPPRVFQVISSCESALRWSLAPGGGRGTPPFLTHAGAERLTRHLYGRQTRAGEVVFGGDRQLAGYDATPDAAGIEVNRRHAAEVLPFLADVPVGRTWAGLMPFSLDGAPLIGRLPVEAPAYVVTGLASSGFGRGPMAGRLLADLIHTGRRPAILDAADPARPSRCGPRVTRWT